MEFVDLSQTPPVKVKVLTLREVAAKFAGSYGYRLQETFQKWIDDKTVETPDPAYVFEDEMYWKPEQVTDWSTLKEKMDSREEAEKAKSLEDASMTKLEMYEAFIDSAQKVVSLNSRSFSHNRGNSLADGRLRTVKLQGQVELFEKLLAPQQLPADLQTKLNQLVAEAKRHVNMQ